MAVKNRATLLSQAQTIRDETTANANTATRVGGHEVDVVDSYILTAEANANYAPLAHTHPTSDIVSGTFADARIAESNVTQHQAALSIAWTQVTGFKRQETFSIPISSAGADLAVATDIIYFRIPYNCTMTAIAASVGTAPTGASVIIDANDGKSGTSIMTTNKCEIEVSETDTLTATTQPTLTTTSFSAGDQIWFDIDQKGSTVAGTDAQVHIQLTET